MTARDADAQKQVPPEKPAPEATPSPSAAEAGAAGEDAAPAPDRTAALEAQVAALEDRLRRQQAEFANQVKQIRKTGEDAVRFAAQPLLSDLLGVVDALHNAIVASRRACGSSSASSSRSCASTASSASTRPAGSSTPRSTRPSASSRPTRPSERSCTS